MSFRDIILNGTNGPQAGLPPKKEEKPKVEEVNLNVADFVEKRYSRRVTKIILNSDNYYSLIENSNFILKNEARGVVKFKDAFVEMDDYLPEYRVVFEEEGSITILTREENIE